MNALSSLDFTIERRSGVDVVIFANDSCRPAMETEVAMWQRLNAASKPITHVVVADTDKFGTVACGYSGTPNDIARAVMAKACAQGYSGTYQERMAELGWRIEPVYLGADRESQSFQEGVSGWMAQCFAPSLYSNMTERGDRLLEEVLELLQAHGYDQTRVPTLVNYVYGRPTGEPAQEVGGVMVTLAAYCTVAGLDMHAAGDVELARITKPEVMERIRAKQEAKNALHFDTPLPGSSGLNTGAPVIDLERIVPPEWWSDQIGGIFDDLSSGQAWRQGFNECRGRTLLLIEQARGMALIDATPKANAPRGDLVPGVVRCAKCSFQLHRTNLYLGSGTTGPGDSKTEPCPNGCGPLWPVTWQTWATEGWQQAERYHEELRQLQDRPRGGSDAQSDFGAMTDLLARWRHNAAIESSPLQAGKVRREVWAQCLSELEAALKPTSHGAGVSK